MICVFFFGLDRFSIDDFEVEDEVRPDFPCPYCYEDFDIVSLCSHLEDEHSCESKVTVRVSLDTPLDLFLFCFVFSEERYVFYSGFLIWFMFWWVTIFVGKVMFAFFFIHRRADISCLSFKGFVFIDLLQKVFFLFIEIAGED